MEQTSKELLIKDLCARLPYGVKVKFQVNEVSAIEEKFIYNIDGEYSYITNGKSYLTLDIIKALFNNHLDYIKPYLFPLSSMTEEQEEEFRNLFYRFHESAFFFNERFAYDRYRIKDIGFYPCYLQDWLLKNNFDVYGLIPMDLAIDATGLDIYTNSIK